MGRINAVRPSAEFAGVTRLLGTSVRVQPARVTEAMLMLVLWWPWTTEPRIPYPSTSLALVYVHVDIDCCEHVVMLIVVVMPIV